MSKIKNGRLDQYSAEPFEQQSFRTAGVKGVKLTGYYVLCRYSQLSIFQSVTQYRPPTILLFGATAARRIGY